jgi:predicted aldo/keto reductase-like oxidoreductase
VCLACKTVKRTAKEAQEDLEESLRALKTDYLDIYQLHGLDDPTDIATVFGPGGAMEAIVGARDKGYVRFIGFTCHLDTSVKSILSQSDEFATMLFPVNFAYGFKKRGGVDALSLCRDYGIGVIAIKALALRKWFDGEPRNYPNCWYRPIYDDLTLAQLALNYAITSHVATTIPPGDKRLFRLTLDIIEEQGGKARPLSPEEHTQLRRKAHEIQDVIF